MKINSMIYRPPCLLHMSTPPALFKTKPISNQAGILPKRIIIDFFPGFDVKN